MVGGAPAGSRTAAGAAGMSAGRGKVSCAIRWPLKWTEIMTIADKCALAACELCGQPTSSAVGVCQREGECRREYGYRRNGTRMPRRTPGPCDVCGRVTVSKYGVCRTGSPECRDEYMRRVAGTKKRGSKVTTHHGRRLVAVPPLDVPEEWRTVAGFEGLYEVSDQGRIKSLPRATGRRSPEYVLTPKLHDRRDVNRPYLDVHLRDADGRARTRKVHRLVAEAFLGPRPKGQVIRHGLGGPSDNRLVNLCYGTPAQNKADQALHRQMMRKGALEGLAEQDALDIYRACVAGHLPARLADEYVAVMRHASALLKRQRITVAAV
jgi:hypothetical protein